MTPSTPPRSHVHDTILLQQLLWMDRRKHQNMSMGIQFLLADFNFMAAYTQESIRLADKRADVLLALSSAMIAGFVVMTQQAWIAPATIPTLALGSAVFLLLIGWVALKQVLTLSINVAEYARAINRIRAYFTESCPEIRSFIMMPTSHQYPPYNWKSSSHSIILVLNSLFVDMACISLAKIARPTLPSMHLIVLFLIGLGLFYGLFTWSVQHFFTRMEHQVQALRKTPETLFHSHESVAHTV